MCDASSSVQGVGVGSWGSRQSLAIFVSAALDESEVAGYLGPVVYLRQSSDAHA